MSGVEKGAGRLPGGHRPVDLQAPIEALKRSIADMERTAGDWGLRADEPAGLFIGSQAEVLKSLEVLYRAFADRVAEIESGGQAIVREMREETAKMYESILMFKRFVGTLHGDYENHNLLGADRAVNQALDKLVTQLASAIQNLTKRPPKRAFKIDRAWWVVAGSVGGLYALYLVTSMTGSAYRFHAEQLASGFTACSYNGVVSGKKVFCPRTDFEAKPTAATLDLSNKNKAHKEPPPGYDGMRY